MSTEFYPSLQNLNDCGCCEGLTVETPVTILNRSGLDAIAYRVGTHAEFKKSLLAELSTHPQLQGLQTREDDDFAIALLDAWATVADVLTFYQERIANESYLRTAKERLSILNLARLIGYELRPGVAASTYLAFTLEDVPTAPRQAIIDIGTKVQSLPGPGEQPQTFETVEKIETRAEWNVIKPKLTERQPIKGDTRSLLFAGVSTGLKAGDSLLIVPDDGGQPVFRQIASITQQPQQNTTLVQLQKLGDTTGVLSQPNVILDKRILVEYSAITKSFLNQTISSPDFYAYAFINGFFTQNIFNNLIAIQPPPPSVITFRVRAAIFGHNAPRWDSLPNAQRYGEYASQDGDTYEFVPGAYNGRQDSWAETTLNLYHSDVNSTNLYLDNVYSNIVKDSYVVLVAGNTWKLHQVKEVTEISKSDFTISAKITKLSLNNKDDFDKFKIRETTVFGQSEELKLARLPITKAVFGNEIELEGWVENLFNGQKIIVCGEYENNRGNQGCEVAIIAEVDNKISAEGGTRLKLTTALQNSYVRDTVTINANIALATHGETKTDVLGSGDASQAYQKFTLRQSPLTYVSSDNATGAESTLKLRVNDILWHEVPTLYGKGDKERIFITRTDDDGKTTIQFGDGKTGARLPTGQENIKATYRQGIGLAGLVKAGQLSLLMTRPLGVKSVNNPIAATGAQDRESLREARRNAPLTVLTLDRIVSLQDYEDFARAFAGIAKALATWTWNGQVRGVFVTVAGYNAQLVSVDSVTYKNLLTQMQKAGDPFVSLTIKSYRPAPFRIAAKVKIDPDYLEEKVLSSVRESLLSNFSFEVQELGQGVTASEVIACIQSVPGVIAVDLDKLYRVDSPGVLNNNRLIAAAPQPGADGMVQAAELLTIDALLLELGVIRTLT
ncbi:putative baseplate assembly protein [Brasilonema sp. UFV-L1]|uniref:putative baseplate assembly protein n=1 Tax=Brasilonema sp. UFV-L1 TaxID=2234130 RepID=UPI00145D0271|nr:putative baseplate assembly protein [Brasilonema sp. UFV-L1]NMG08784.1 putative baseplate assembly protein [Brasilonema sp. UFV-L1]